MDYIFQRLIVKSVEPFFLIAVCNEFVDGAQSVFLLFVAEVICFLEIAVVLQRVIQVLELIDGIESLLDKELMLLCLGIGRFVV